MSRRLQRAAFLAAIEASIEATLVDEAWRDWRGDPEVSVAVRLERPDEADTRLYCFLPMGATVAGPFVGHVNAPFAVALARDDLVRGAPLNDFLFDAAADLVASAALAVRDHPDGRAAVADLVGWDEGGAKRLVRAFSQPRQRPRDRADRPCPRGQRVVLPRRRVRLGPDVTSADCGGGRGGEPCGDHRPVVGRRPRRATRRGRERRRR